MERLYSLLFCYKNMNKGCEQQLKKTYKKL
nr:MAG TPA: hypothetical protein [Caudoviricetes sp.]DAR19068.1 MAG TPA: hypothetical protein [Caudoviricetes sp.]